MSQSNQSANNSIVVGQLNAVFEAAHDGIIVINGRGIMQRVNDATCKLFGYEKAEMEGQNVSLLMPNPYRDKHDGYLNNYHKTGQAKIIGIGREVVGLKKNGEKFPLRLAVSEATYNNEVLYVGIIHDLTEIKAASLKIEELNKALEEKVKLRTNELEETIKKLQKENKERKQIEKVLRHREHELRDALEKEKEVNEMKSRFVSIASHEFRTPLSTILSSADLIEVYQEGYHQTKRTKHINRIKSAVNNLNNILNDFLSLARMEEKQLNVKRIPFNLKNFLKEAADEVDGLLKDGQKLEIYTPCGDCDVITDKYILKNGLLNLLSNAIKYSPEKAVIQATATFEKDWLEISVKDEGIGIPVEDQKHLFTRFYRASNASGIQGTGLGLNIVRRYIELLSGEVKFESERDKGSTFIIRIPLR